MATGLKTQELIPSKAPNLLIAPTEYSQQYMDQANNSLRLYFNQLDNFSFGLINSSGGGSISFPYGAFSSGVTQTTATNTATALTFDSNDFTNGFSIVGNSRVTPAYAGLYNLQFSIQVQSLSTATEDVYVWLRQYTANNSTLTDIAGSTGFISMLPRKSAGNPSHDIKGWNYYVSLAVGDYLEIVWSTTNGTDVTIPYYAASSTPTKPSTQSVVATMTFVSSLL
jgi:hypothetical protein